MSSELSRLIEEDIMADIGPANNGSSSTVDLSGALKFSAQAVYDVQSPSAKTFDNGTNAVLVNQGVTYTAVTRGTAGNSITIALIDPGVDGALSISVVGTAISVTLAYATGAVTTTATQLVAALLLDSGVTALVTPSGSGASPLNALSATALATGSASEVNVADDELTIPSHGFVEGVKVQLTTTGTLPAGLSLATDYFVIVIDANTIQLASSLANALAGTPVDITDQGSSGGVNTATPVALSGASVTFQKSNDGTNWIDVQTATSITVDGSVMIENAAVSYRYFKAVKALTAGVVDLQVNVLVIGQSVGA